MAEMEFHWNADRTRFGAGPADAENGAPPVAFADVRLRDDTLVVLHTETHPDHQGEGLAGRLTRRLLDEARAEGWRVEPRCPYTASWMDRHPEYANLRAE